MPWNEKVYVTDNIDHFYTQTPYGFRVREVSRNTFDGSMSLTLDCNGIDRETLMKQICGNLNLTKKETNKMEAKKCDRCGKLYEKKFDKNDIRCVFKHEEPFFTDEEKNYSKEFIEDKKTHDVIVKRGNGDYIDMCPDCRKAFKTWFESADKEGKKNG